MYLSKERKKGLKRSNIASNNDNQNPSILNSWMNKKQYTSEYKALINAIHRCHNKGHRAYPSYGARGIYVCQRWYYNFDAFIADMGPKPAKAYSLDRINNDGPYEPSNCRWATRSQQQRNQRPRRGQEIIEILGEKGTIPYFAKKYGLDQTTLRSRHRKGWIGSRLISPPTLVKGVNKRKMRK